MSQLFPSILGSISELTSDSESNHYHLSNSQISSAIAPQLRFLIPPRKPTLSFRKIISCSPFRRDDAAVGPKSLLPAIPERARGKKCLVLDLDETLVHSSFKPVPDADFVVPVEIESIVHQVRFPARAVLPISPRGVFARVLQPHHLFKAVGNPLLQLFFGIPKRI